MKLICWNIKFFSLAKIKSAADAGFYGANGFLQTQARLEHILNHVTRYNPDVFIVIELRSSQGDLGSLVTGNGAQGARELLSELRLAQSDAQWCLVPPLKLTQRPVLVDSYTEGIAVYFKNTTLEFIGPYVWPAGGVPTGHNEKVAVPNTTGVATTNYPDPWDNALPDGNRYAGQYEFFADATRTEYISFDGYNPYQSGGPPNDIADLRKPFLTRFQERRTGGRVFTIVSVHPAPSGQQRRYPSALSRVYELQPAQQQHNEAVILCGDFNIDLLGDDVLDISAYNFLTADTWGQQYFLCFSNGYRYMGRDIPANRPRTIQKNVDDATPQSYTKAESLDNMAVRYAPDSFISGMFEMPVVADMVAGTEDIHSDMLDPLATFLQSGSALSNATFRIRDNYGHIGYSPGTSDHMAVYAQF